MLSRTEYQKRWYQKNKERIARRQKRSRLIKQGVKLGPDEDLGLKNKNKFYTFCTPKDKVKSDPFIKEKKIILSKQKSNVIRYNDFFSQEEEKKRYKKKYNYKFLKITW